MSVTAKYAPRAQLGALGSLASLMLRPGPLQADAARRALEDPAADRLRLDTWAGAARDYSGATSPALGTVARVDLTERISWQDYIMYDPPPRQDVQRGEGDEPFIHLILTLADGSEMHLSDIDRPVGRGREQAQLEGRVMDVSQVHRAYAEAKGLITSMVSVRLRNEDGALSHLFRDPDAGFMQVTVEIRVGFRHLPPSQYRPVGVGWSIARVESADASSVTLQLSERGDVHLGAVRRIPTLGDIRHDVARVAAQATTDVGSPWPQSRLLLGRDSEDVPCPVIFGRELAPLTPFVTVVDRYGAGDGYKISKAIGVFVLGASRASNAAPAQANLITEEDTPGPVHDGQRFRLLTPAGSAGFSRFLSYQAGSGRVPWVFAQVRRVSATVDGATWWVWVLVLGSRYDSTSPGEQQAALDAAAWVAGLLDRDDLYAEWPAGAEGQDPHPQEAAVWWRGRHDPASIIMEIAQRYLVPSPVSLLDTVSFGQLSAMHPMRSWSSCRLAGEIRDGMTGAEIVDAIGRSHGLDFWWSTGGKLRVRPADITRHDLDQHIPGARRYSAEYDILRDTWQERVPLASERWGIANSFRVSGAKPDAIEGDGTWDDWRAREDSERWGRILEADMDMTWWDRRRRASDAASSVLNRAKLHRRSTFRASLYALELELGDYLRISHRAGLGEDGGYRERLVRVEGVSLDWGGKQVEVSVVDMGWIEPETETPIQPPGMLDDERHWVRMQRLQADGIHRVSLTKDSKAAVLHGDDWIRAGLKPGDILVATRDGWEETHRIESFAPVGGAVHVVLEDAAEETREASTFRLERSHLDPPSRPDRYPLGSVFYTRLADEDSETFSDGAPAYRLLPE